LHLVEAACEYEHAKTPDELEAPRRMRATPVGPFPMPTMPASPVVRAVQMRRSALIEVHTTVKDTPNGRNVAAIS
jgi:hypothetical protein